MVKQVKVEQIQIFVSGKVQGVGFRYATQKAAVEFGLSGWVRNLPDGRVEISAEGSANALDALVEWCSVGPPGAGVTQVEVEQRRGLTDTPAETFTVRK